ncbi:hypothetical protein [Chitinophaga polysaccharea]|uniref:hypothetical protein n=1 Tax=Chitinophaga polysaccharea TaxID=1293035 RepID=UPI001157A763|nr:hypothetical protein [Chitinophaga polysaccharea]
MDFYRMFRTGNVCVPTKRLRRPALAAFNGNYFIVAAGMTALLLMAAGNAVARESPNSAGSDHVSEETFIRQ